MITFLLVAVIVLTILLLLVIGYIWYQFNFTDSRLFRIIDRRISLYHAGDGLPDEDECEDLDEDEEDDD